MLEWMWWVIGDHHWGFPHCGTGFPHSGDVTVGFPSARDDVTDDDDDNVEMLLWQRLSREQHDVTGATRLHKRHSNGAVINCHNHWHSPTHGVTYLQTHTHHLTALFPGLPRWAGTRKVKPIWILQKQETVSGSGISWAVCKSAPRSRQITTPAPHHSVFYRPDALPADQPTASKHWRQLDTHK